MLCRRLPVRGRGHIRSSRPSAPFGASELRRRNGRGTSAIDHASRKATRAFPASVQPEDTSFPPADTGIRARGGRDLCCRRCTPATEAQPGFGSSNRRDWAEEVRDPKSRGVMGMSWGERRFGARFTARQGRNVPFGAEIPSIVRARELVIEDSLPASELESRVGSRPSDHDPPPFNPTLSAGPFPRAAREIKVSRRRPAPGGRNVVEMRTSLRYLDRYPHIYGPDRGESSESRALGAGGARSDSVRITGPGLRIRSPGTPLAGLSGDHHLPLRRLRCQMPQESRG